MWLIKTKNVSEFQTVYNEIHMYLTKRRYKPKYYQIDNKLAKNTKLKLEEIFNVIIEIVPL